MITWLKDPNAKLDWYFDWSDWLEEGESIFNATIDIQGSVTLDSQSNDGKIVTVWLSGGNVNEESVVTCHIETDSDRIDERSINLRLQER